MVKSKCSICNKNAVFAINTKSQRYCSLHKLDDMIDIKNKKCITCNIKRSNFNYVNESKALYCSDCKLDDMIDIKHKKCITCNFKRPIFNYVNEPKALYCGDCKLDDMIDIISKKCTNCNINYASRNYKPHCFNCFGYLSPNDSRVRNFKTKEQAYMSEIQKVYPDIILDQKVNGGCSRRRPDGLIDCLTHSVIIEIDENEHKSYDDSCSNFRMMELFEDLGSRPIVFIRFNPDSYKLNNTRVRGSFGITKVTGELKKVNLEFSKRLSELLTNIQYQVSNIPDKEITIEYICYSDN